MSSRGADKMTAAVIEDELRAMFREIERQPVPGHILALIAKLEAQDAANEDQAPSRRARKSVTPGLRA